MYIHLGDNFVVPSKDVVMILDYSTSKTSPIVMEYLEKQKTDMSELSRTDAKSIVVTVNKIYFSSLASGTLKKRAQTAFDIDSQTGKSRPV
ncbi:extracellular matrix regulator RemB [Metabacillus sp. RGM 3146]|uniref:extracellular matrix regulator RemB n=1 Tax=Metabacillus sp. RGM 3146 TaxID=3401092 RepID=UPI003B9D07B5